MELDTIIPTSMLAIINDTRGHGKSVKVSEDLGFFYKGGWKAAVDDILTINEYIRTLFPGLPLTLFGHSMGSLLVRSFTKRHSDCIDTLFVCGSPSYNQATPVGKILADIIGVTRGWHYRSPLLQKMSMGAYNKPFKDENYRNAWVCSDKEILEAYHNDPLCKFVFTANGFSNLLSLVMDCYSPSGWTVSDNLLPVHFISGRNDPCRVNDKEHNKSVELMKKVGFKNVDSVVYDGMRHEILNETEKSRVWNDILKRLA